MPRFYIVHNGEDAAAPRVAALESAARARGIEPCPVDSSIARHTHDLPPPRPGDLLYNCARGSTFTESLLLSTELATMYRVAPIVARDTEDSVMLSLALQKRGVPAPRTEYLDRSRSESLPELVARLGGFPLVVKVQGGTRGVGTMLAESLPSLRAMLDFLSVSGRACLLREHIRAPAVFRAVVLGDEVVSVTAKQVRPDDFRSGARSTTLRAEEDAGYRAIAEVAKAAAVAANQEFSGVDVMPRPDGSFVVLEVNMPHDFVTHSAVANVDLAALATDHLLQKSAAIRAAR